METKQSLGLKILIIVNIGSCNLVSPCTFHSVHMNHSIYLVIYLYILAAKTSFMA